MESRQGAAADTAVSLFPAAILLQHTPVINPVAAARRLTPCCSPHIPAPQDSTLSEIINDSTGFQVRV